MTSIKAQAPSVDALVTEMSRTAHHEQADQVGAAKTKLHRHQEAAKKVRAQIGDLESRAAGLRKELDAHEDAGWGLLDYVGLGDFDAKRNRISGQINQNAATAQERGVDLTEAREEIEQTLEAMQEDLDALKDQIGHVDAIVEQREIADRTVISGI